MVEKFNFYDIYGYLLPGLVFIGLASLPFGLIFGIWPKADISSAILVLLAGYILGHIFQGFANKLIPSTVKDNFGNDRHPSDLVLDPSDYTLTRATKKKLAALSAKYFEIDLAVNEDLGDWQSGLEKYKEEIDQEKDAEKKAANKKALRAGTSILETARNNRTDAFYLARSALLRDKKPSYWEQFEGLYALMRGVTMALGVAALFFLGWAASFWSKQAAWPGGKIAFVVVLIVIAVISLLTDQLRPKANSSSKTAADLTRLVKDDKPPDPNAEKREKNRATTKKWREKVLPGMLALLFAFGLFFAGARLGSEITIVVPPAKPACGDGLLLISTCSSVSDSKEAQTEHVKIDHPGFVLLLLALVSVIGLSRSYGAYKVFAREFAVNVWRDFATIESPKSAESDDLHV